MLSRTVARVRVRSATERRVPELVGWFAYTRGAPASSPCASSTYTEPVQMMCVDIVRGSGRAGYAPSRCRNGITFASVGCEERSSASPSSSACESSIGGVSLHCRNSSSSSW